MPDNLEPPTPNATPPANPQRSGSHPQKPQRVLACVYCQQRKIKCDRHFPCGHCLKAGTQCVPAASLAPRPRRRRFPERELLVRLRHYEDLLRQNGIKFEPLHKDTARERGRVPPGTTADGGCESDEEGTEGKGVKKHENPLAHSHASSPCGTEVRYRTKDMAKALLNQVLEDSESDTDSSHSGEFCDTTLRKAWDEQAKLFESGEHGLLVGSGRTLRVDLSAFHPEPVHIFKLWQIYLDNVDPLFKVTHTPTLQGRIIEAVGDLTQASPELEALMFGIYSLAVRSLPTDNDLHATFGLSREQLLNRYQFGCEQALANCGFMRSSDLDSLTALHFHLVSIYHTVEPRTHSATLGIAMRIAKRMGLHSEAACAAHPPLEAELRRRLWWSLIAFDARISEIADQKFSSLAPTWDCAVPRNVSDSDLRPGMKAPPAALPGAAPTEALYAVVNGELADFVRNTSFFLDYTSPVLKAIARDVQGGPVPDGGELVALERLIEDRYIRFCDPENPLHFTTIWTARGYLAKCRFLEHYSHYAPAMRLTDAARDTAVCLAFTMLECDTKLTASPLAARFAWFADFHFPFTAFVHIVQDLRRRPAGPHAARAWAVMSDNFDVRFGAPTGGGARFTHFAAEESPFLRMFVRSILRAWEAYEVAARARGEEPALPRIVVRFRAQVAAAAEAARGPGGEHMAELVEGMGDVSMQLPGRLGEGHALMYGMAWGQGALAGVSPGSYPGSDSSGMTSLEMDANALDLAAMDWTLAAGRGW